MEVVRGNSTTARAQIMAGIYSPELVPSMHPRHWYVTFCNYQTWPCLSRSCNPERDLFHLWF